MDTWRAHRCEGIGRSKTRPFDADRQPARRRLSATNKVVLQPLTSAKECKSVAEKAIHALTLHQTRPIGDLRSQLAGEVSLGAWPGLCEHRSPKQKWRETREETNTF